MIDNFQRVMTHKPMKVVDLLECAYVSASVEDNRTFVIGFKDTKRSIVEMAALTRWGIIYTFFPI